MKKLWKFIIGFIVLILVLSLAMTVGAIILLAVSIYFGVKYYQAYRKDKSSVTPVFKQWWLYTGILSLLFMFASFGSSSTDDVKPAKLAVNETFVTNDKGVATISGKTSPDYDVKIDDSKQTTADSSGKFSIEYPLTASSEKSVRVEATKDYNDKTKKSKMVTIKPSKKFVAALKSSESSLASSSEAEKSSSIAASQSESVVEASESSQSAAESSEKAATPVEYTSALIKATRYAKLMHMSKQGLYEQLTSTSGEGFSAEAAQYAIDNIKADWNANALSKAKSYQDQMAMSPAAIQEQLTSSAGEKFTAEEAQYAIDNLNK